MSDKTHSLCDVLREYCHKDILPMHMPGHKRNKKFRMDNPYAWDVTEVSGLDDLHNPQGILKKWMERAANLYGADESRLLINGSTGGILAAITACCRRGDRILVARNCHKSVYNAIKLLELCPVYLYPEQGSWEMEQLGIAGAISDKTVRNCLEQVSDVACAIITSPTYEGIVSPIADIAREVHKKGIPLIVDEAHGAHFHWHSMFPDTALTEGADIVIESLHKTLPAFTQTGILHMRRGLVDEEKLWWSLQTYQTSSPSYILMAGADQCLTYLETEGQKDFDWYAKNLKNFYQDMKHLKYLRFLDEKIKEKSKLVIITENTNMNGAQLAACLRNQYGIETEMSCGNYCLAMSSVADDESSFSRLSEALRAIDSAVQPAGENAGTEMSYVWQQPRVQLYSFETGEWNHGWISLQDAVGETAAQSIYLYPPGIPVLVEGEVFSKELVELLRNAEMTGSRIHGMIEGRVSILTERKA